MLSKRHKIIKISITVLIAIMSIAMIVNYNLNFIDSEDIAENNQENQKYSHESIIVSPEYYSSNKKNNKIFIKADFANKNNHLINLKKLSGFIELSENLKLDYIADSAKMNIKTKHITLDNGVQITDKNSILLKMPILLINYANYELSSSQGVTLSYKNIHLTSNSVKFKENQPIVFHGSVNLDVNSVNP
jgi:hypothetical protein